MRELGLHDGFDTDPKPAADASPLTKGGNTSAKRSSSKGGLPIEYRISPEKADGNAAPRFEDAYGGNKRKNILSIKMQPEEEGTPSGY